MTHNLQNEMCPSLTLRMKILLIAVLLVPQLLPMTPSPFQMLPASPLVPNQQNSPVDVVNTLVDQYINDNNRIICPHSTL